MLHPPEVEQLEFRPHCGEILGRRLLPVMVPLVVADHRRFHVRPTVPDRAEADVEERLRGWKRRWLA